MPHFEGLPPLVPIHFWQKVRGLTPPLCSYIIRNVGSTPPTPEPVGAGDSSVLFLFLVLLFLLFFILLYIFFQFFLLLLLLVFLSQKNAKTTPAATSRNHATICSRRASTTWKTMRSVHDTLHSPWALAPYARKRERTKQQQGQVQQRKGRDTNQQGYSKGKGPTTGWIWQRFQESTPYKDRTKGKWPPQ